MNKSNVQADLEKQIEMVLDALKRAEMASNRAKVFQYGMMLHNLRNCLNDRDYDRAEEIVKSL